jgi:hypothetical protein
MAGNFVLPQTWLETLCSHKHGKDTLWNLIHEGLENGEEAWKIRKANKHGQKLCAPTNTACYFVELNTWRLTKWRGGLEDKKPTSMAWNFVLPQNGMILIPEGLENGEEAWKIRSLQTWPETLCFHKHGMILYGVKYLKA